MRGGLRAGYPEGRAGGTQLRARVARAHRHAAGEAHRLQAGAGRAAAHHQRTQAGTHAAEGNDLCWVKISFWYPFFSLQNKKSGSVSST